MDVKIRNNYASKDDINVLTNRVNELTNTINMILLEQDGLNLRHIENPSYTDCLIAVQENGLALQYVPKDNLTVDIMCEAVKEDSEAGQFVRIENEDDGFSIIEANIYTIKYITRDNVSDLNILDKLQIYAIDKDPDLICDMDLVNPLMWIKAINDDQNLIKSIPKETLKSILNELVLSNPHAVVQSISAIKMLTPNQAISVMKTVPYDAGCFITYRPEEEHEKLWDTVFKTAPSMISDMDNLLGAPAIDVDYHIHLIRILGDDVIKRFSKDILRKRELEDYIIKYAYCGTLRDIKYKPKRLINKFRLWKRYYL